MSEAGWDDYFARVRTLNRDEVESEVLEYKREAEQYLRSVVTNEVLSSNDNWIRAAKKHLNPLGFWMRVEALSQWWDEEPKRVAAALRGLWGLYDGSPEGLPPRDEVITRIRTFANQLPAVDKNLRCPEGRMGLISALLIRIRLNITRRSVRKCSERHTILRTTPSRPRIQTRRLCISTRWSFSTSSSRRLGRVDSSGRATSSKHSR